MPTSSRPGHVEVLISAERIAARVRALGEEITRDHAGKPLAVVGVLKGSFIFLADLVRAIDLPVQIDFIGITSYQGKSTSGVVQITSDLTRPIDGKHVLLVEDIVDTGLTMNYIIELLETRKPASVKLCALLHKPSRTRKATTIHYLGFEIPDLFVIGYGLDYAQRYRNLPYIGVME